MAKKEIDTIKSSLESEKTKNAEAKELIARHQN
jgi:hypothetical protein